MTQDELTKLINEFLPYPSQGQHYALRQFANLVAQNEREACLKLADSLGWVNVDHIRARGQT